MSDAGGPHMTAPVLEVDRLDAVVMFLMKLKAYFLFMTDSKKMQQVDVVSLIKNICFKERATYLWVQTVTFTGTWEDLNDKIVARFIRPADRKGLGRKLVYGTYQNKLSIKEYGAAFEEAITAAKLAKFPLSDPQILLAYEHGLNDSFKNVLVLRDSDFADWRACEDSLLRAEADKLDILVGGKSRGGYNNRNNYNKYNQRDQSDDRATHKHVNGNYDDNSNSSNYINSKYGHHGNAGNGGRGNGSSSSTSGRGFAGDSRGGGRGNGGRGDGLRECHSCGSYDHLKARCDASKATRDAYQRHRKQNM